MTKPTMNNRWLRQPSEAELAAGNGILTTRKILRTQGFDLHLMEAGEGILRIAFTALGAAVPTPTIGIRPELFEALSEVAASEPYVVDIAEFERLLEAKYQAPAAGSYVKRITMGDFSCVWDGITLIVKENNVEGTLVATISSPQVGQPDKDKDQPSCQFGSHGSRKVYGCGEKYGWMNRFGTVTRHWNTDVMGITDLHHGVQKEYHTAVPFFISERAESQGFTGFYADNSWRTAFDFGKSNPEYFGFKAEGGSLDLYLMPGKTVGEVVRKYALVTGSMPMPRKDFLGFQQCRWSYMDQHEVLEIAESMRNHQIPCDVLYLDIDYMDAYKVFTIDSSRFPDFSGMIKKLRDMGFKTVAIVDPGVKAEKGYGVYERGLEADAFVLSSEGLPYVGEVWPGRSVYPDFLNETTRKWWGREHEGLLNEGVDGIWNDMNEPADFTTEAKTLPETCLHRDDAGRLRPHTEIHNMYAAYEAMATYDHMQSSSEKPQPRPFVLTRSAFAGTQRHAAIWTGDNTSLWEHMESAVPMLLNLGLSGFSYAGGDVGGFLEDSSGEMLARWTQLGAFMPLFRNHSAKDTLYQEPWRFGDEVLSIVRSAIELRYSLITYLYQQMQHSHTKGDPVMRPLFYEMPPGTGLEENSSDLWNLNDQFLFGDDLMVCPILRPGLTKRMVYFPGDQEEGWYDFQTGERIEGNQWVVVSAPLDKIPLYVREGAILPIDAVQTHIKVDDSPERICFYIYGSDTGKGAKGSATFYFDDGLGLDERQTLVTVHYQVRSDESRGVDVVVSKTGDYKVPEMEFIWKGLGQEKTLTIRHQ